MARAGGKQQRKAGHQNFRTVSSKSWTRVWLPARTWWLKPWRSAVGTNEFLSVALISLLIPVSLDHHQSGQLRDDYWRFGAVLSVAVQSVYTVSYQWLQNGTNLVGQNSSTLTLSSLESDLQRVSLTSVLSPTTTVR